MPRGSNSAPFIASMVLFGMVGFYLGIDIPRLRLATSMRPRVDPVELLSATGTFLAAVAALISVYGFVFDEVLGGFEYIGRLVVAARRRHADRRRRGGAALRHRPG